MELNIHEFIDKAKLLGLDIKDIPGYKNHKWKLISLSDTEHVILVPDDVTKFSKNTSSFTKAIQNLKGNIKVIGGHNLTTAFCMFKECQAQSIDLSSFDTSNITDMGNMFASCKAEYLNLQTFNTSKVESMHRMFAHCKVKLLDLSSFDTSNVMHFSLMFHNCKSEVINLSSFIIREDAWMRGTFADCSAKIIRKDKIFYANEIYN